MEKSVLVLGSGGREHCLAWKLENSENVKKVYTAPGNGGTQLSNNITNVDLNIGDFGEVSKWCHENQVDLVVVGPEDPLANGIVDILTQEGIPCFGPSAKAAQIEASKEFAKAFMDKHKIPTARWRSFTDPEKATAFIKEADFNAWVVKASGLAAGKGVVVCKNNEEACSTVKEMLVGEKLGSAGHIIVVEELLEGEEVSCLAFSDGKDVVCFPPAQDHKRLLDRNQGPNTGGMGAYCPCPLITQKELSFITKNVMQKAVDGMMEDGMPYVGVLYAGIMLSPNGPKVLEYNCRLGDPETQVLLPLLKSDLYIILKACVEGNLHQHKHNVIFEENQHAVGVVLVSEGYPGKYSKGLDITDVDALKTELQLEVFHAGTKVNGDKLVTNGGRVLAVVAKDADLATAAWKAQLGASRIKFTGKFFRRDIAQSALQKKTGASLTYSDSGVDIGAGDAFVQAIRPAVKQTSRIGCSADLGGFGGIFDVKAAGYTDPLLVSGTDGVGTKLKIAQETRCHSTIGEDLVAMCVNDILCHGAEPLYFLDYFACGKLDVNIAREVVEGITSGCKLAGCALQGGETAEMPGMYKSGEYDLAGFAVGAVERCNYLPKLKHVQSGDVIIGISSTGPHSNGYSLIRRVVEHCGFTYDMLCPWDHGKSLGLALLAPTRIYVKSVQPLLHKRLVKSLAHVTGGGIPGNLVRVLPDGIGAKLDANKWHVHPVFSWIAEKGNVSGKEMCRTFNLGIGLALVVSAETSEEVLECLAEAGETAAVVGSITKHDSESERIKIDNVEVALHHAHHKHHFEDGTVNCNDKRPRLVGQKQQKKKVGVLISGTGTNLQALIDHTIDPTKESSSEIVLVISNKPNVQGLKRAQAAGIQTEVVEHKKYSTREEFDAAVNKLLEEAGVEFVCLAGFMRILSGKFVKNWRGKLLNVHPSLLPSFKGMNAHKQVLEAGVRVSGCSVHFVAEEVDEGAILVQETVPVWPGDTEDTLCQRVKEKEHIAFPTALELLASSKVQLGKDGKCVWSL